MYVKPRECKHAISEGLMHANFSTTRNMVHPEKCNIERNHVVN